MRSLTSRTRMSHPLRVGVLHDLAAKTELDCKLLRVFDEFLRYDKRTQRREGVMGFTEQPVRAMPTVTPAAPVGHVVLQGIAENVLRRLFHRHTASRAPDDNIQLALPIDTLAGIGNSNRFAVRDHRRNGLGEQIWVLPRVVRLALPDTGDGFGRILRSRLGTGTGLHFSVVLTIVHRRIQNGHGIHHGRQNLDRLQIVYVDGPWSRSSGSRSNSIEASPNFFISRNKLLHIPWCSHFCGTGRTLKRDTGTRDIYDDTIAQYQTDEGLIAALKST